MYRLEELYAEYVAVLFGEGRHAEDFHDNAIGRALLKLFEAQSLIIDTGLCAQAVQRLALPPTETVHLDTTSMTLTGAYPDPDAGAQGYNKDGHPECLQLVAGLVTRADGIPISMSVEDVHISDTTWTHSTLLHAGSLLAEDLRSQIVFAADSKMVSEAAVEVKIWSRQAFSSCRVYRTTLPWNGRRRRPPRPGPSKTGMRLARERGEPPRERPIAPGKPPG